MYGCSSKYDMSYMHLCYHTLSTKKNNDDVTNHVIP